MAISPRHPIMFYAVQQILLSMLMDEMPSSPAEKTTSRGSTVLTLAFQMFQEEVDEVRQSENRDLLPGVYQGVMGRSVRIVSTGGLNIPTVTETNVEDRNDRLVESIFKNEDEKEAEYQKMGMTALNTEHEGSDVAPHLSCRQKLYHFA